MLGLLRHSIWGHLKTQKKKNNFLILIFLIGVVAGAFAVKTLPDEQKAELISYLRLFFQGLSTSSDTVRSPDLLYSALYNNAKTIGIIWLLGFTVIGVLIFLFIIFTRGFVIGFTVGFLVNEYLVRGLAFALVSTLPHNFFAVPSLLLTGVAAISFSIHIIKVKKKQMAFLPRTIHYTLLCTCTLLVMLVAGIIEVMISPVFMKMVAAFLMKY